MALKASEKTDKAAVLGSALKGMFKKFERRPIPDHIRTVVDQLDAAEVEPLKKSG
jgi:hypothetical protein